MLNMGDSLYEVDLRVTALDREGRRCLERQAGERAEVVRRGPLYVQGRHLMVRLGDLLVAAGCQLQARFAVESGATG